MKATRIARLFGVAAALAMAAPASAQFFFKPPDLHGDPVRGDEAGIVLPLPDATPAELEAGLLWSLRAGLNVAALQCQFEPTLLTVPNYNALLVDHKAELQQSLDTLGGYFARVKGSKKAGQDALDQFGTRTYSGFSTVAAQYTFCQTAGSIGRDALFAPRGGLVQVARLRMRELRNSLQPNGERQFHGIYVPTAPLPPLDRRCWNKRGEFQPKKCPAVRS